MDNLINDSQSPLVLNISLKGKLFTPSFSDNSHLLKLSGITSPTLTRLASKLTPLTQNSVKALPCFMLKIMGIANAEIITRNKHMYVKHTPTPEKNMPSESPLFAHIRNKQLNAVKHLLDTGVDSNSVNALNETALELAIKQNAPEIVKCLLEYGARPNYLEGHVSCNKILATASGGNTRFYEMPLDQAYKIGNNEMITLLKTAGAKSINDCFTAEDQGKTP